MLKSTVLTAAIAGTLGYGLWLGANIVRSPEAAKTIQASNNVIINIGAGELGITAENFEATIKASIGDKDRRP